jgi:ABC-type polar amino acid transport system ATPase subunit
MGKLFKALIGLAALAVAATAVYAWASSGKRGDGDFKLVAAEVGSITEKALAVGQIQRIAIARALAMDPDIVLADEPTGNLDSTSGRDIMGIFLDLAKQGRTLVVITHDLTLARRASRIVEIRDGKIVRDGPAAETAQASLIPAASKGTFLPELRKC